MDAFYYIIVTVFGNIVTALFTKEKKSAKTIVHLILLFALCGIENLILQQRLSTDLIYMLYPLTVYLPLILYYIFVLKTPVCQAIFAVTGAYMLTTPRKWICLFFKNMINGGAAADILIQICVSAGLIFVVYKFVSPVVIKIFSFGKQEANYLCVMPLTAYIITYATTVYSDVLFKYPSITIPLLTTVMSVSFIGFEVYFFNYSAKKSNLQHAQELFKMQINSAKKLFLSKEEENFFCKNQAANSLLSMYKYAAKEKNILFACSCKLPEDTDSAEVFAILSYILNSALNSAKSYIKLEILKIKNQIFIKVQTDGDASYETSFLNTLQLACSKSGGMLYTNNKQYDIQVAIKDR